jgi:exodeoxyribonuclease-3
MNKIKIISWNVNGIRAVHKKGFLNWFAETKPDILCLQETKAHEEQLPDVLKNVNGYKSFFCSGERKGYSGVATFTKEAPVSVNKWSKNGKFEGFNVEGRILIP